MTSVAGWSTAQPLSLCALAASSHSLNANTEPFLMNSLCFQFEMRCLGPVTHVRNAQLFTGHMRICMTVTCCHARVCSTKPDSRLEPGPPDLEAGALSSEVGALSLLLPDRPVLMFPLPSTTWHTFFRSSDLFSLCPLVPRAKVQQRPVVPFVLG